MEPKNFLEVFSTLKLNDELAGIFGTVMVKRIVNNRTKNCIRIYINSTRLIQKEAIYEVEKCIEHLFYKQEVNIKIIEHFNLSAQYTPENLYEAYKESILQEIYNNSRMEHSILSRAEVSFQEDIMLLRMPKTVISTVKSKELKRILEKIFNERCGIPVEVVYEFLEPGQSKYSKLNEIQIENEAASIIAAAEAKVLISQNKKTENHNDKLSSPLKNNRGTVAYSNKNGGYQKGYRRSGNPNLIYGREFDDFTIDMKEIEDEMGEVAVRGQICIVEERPIKNEKTILSVVLTDYTDSIVFKMFVKNENLLTLRENLKKGEFIKVKGVTVVDKFDKDLVITSISSIMKTTDFSVKRMDNSAEKRVELHCHTKLSDMDGLADAKSLIARCKEWGHSALAITDHGVVQGFTEAWHALQKLEKNYDFNKPFDFKMIYGVEAYLVDDLKEIVVHSKNQSLMDDYVVFDIETTGLSVKKNKIIEIGAVKVSGGKITDRFSSFINPLEPISYKIETLTGISDDMVMDAPLIKDILHKFLEFSKGCVLVAHNAEFDTGFIKNEANKQKLSCEFTIVDTVSLARILIPQISRYKLNNVAKALNIPLKNHHRAVDDAECTADIFVKFIKMLKDRDVNTLDELNALGSISLENIKKQRSFHAIILATSEIGRHNLYRLISKSHINYYHRWPRLPKSEFLKYKEGLLIGSACEAGELYQAILEEKGEEEIARLVEFYDYLEIQPLGNNQFLIRDEKREDINSDEDLIQINKKIVDLGNHFNKMVVATCDVHFLDPQDEVYRRIIMASKGFKDADDQAPLYLRTTEEMLEEFKYLGSDKAYEVVVTNTNKIANMVENMFPVSADKCPPIIENSAQTLRDICYQTAYEMYGKNLPDIVIERLERELNSIISNGFAVMYIIAQKLVWKSNEDGYLVGSRGSVGSSFVATMAGITEVNPLRAHYYCKKCHYYDFDSKEVKKYAGASGCDMPDKLCPDCGEDLVKAGFDIPFEVFLGFKGNKEPDIDLNFSGEYQSKAHEYTEVIFGKGQTYRAGTIGTIADKTAEGYVRKYCEERGLKKRRCEVSRIAEGCTGVRRTTGQHPGGIIVLPIGYDINSFTPVQHPANDMTTKTITTHFDYHSIDHNLLKLDILGHDDPTMIRMLEDLTGLDAKDIPLDNNEVMSLFAGTKALGISPQDIGGCELGCLGIPEFGTDFVIQMLKDTKPKSFSDLIRISGLSHGTDVWLNNAQYYIKNGDCTISTAICTRDDMMIYLINMGLDSEESFEIMEAVRKGKGLKPEWETDMLAHDVPQWYIDSCNKIKYMFPKAHAAAYVMMAFRIAYFKVFYPLAYYAAYFSIRASAFNYEYMCRGREKLEFYIIEFKKRKDKKELTTKEEDVLKDMKLVQEMYARGYEFEQIDLFKVAAKKFQIFGNKIMPALSAIDGLGDKAANSIVEAAKKGPFLSKEDFRIRAKVGKTIIEFMSELGIFGDLPESNQISLFDLISSTS